MANAKQQYVYLIPQRNEQNAVVGWTWLYNGQFGAAADFPVIEAKKNSGAHDIYFTIVDQQNAIKFAGYDGPDVAKAIGIAKKQLNGPKPKTGIDTKGEFKKVDFSNDYGTQIFLDNLNKNDVVFSYTLNFVDSLKNNTPVIPIDPEIRNNGGGGIMIDAYAIGAAFVGALLAVLVVRYALGWRRQ
jgi:hypothetical protein